MNSFLINFILYFLVLTLSIFCLGLLYDRKNGRTWNDGSEDRKEGLNRLIQSWSQRLQDIRKSWKIFRRSILALVGLFLIIAVSTISIFADDIAVEHPYRNLQDTEDLWWIDNEPKRLEPFSEGCDWHEQSIDLFKIKNKGYPRYVTAVSDPVLTKNGSLSPNNLEIITLVSIEDDLGYELNNSILIVHNETTFFVTDDALNVSGSKIWVMYEFNNEGMHHSWLPDGYDVCIMGTTNSGQDLFSKILYGSRISLKIGITVAFLTVALGTVIGSISGYYGGVIDELIMRLTDVFFAVPGLILAMAFVAALQNTTSMSLPMSAISFLLLLFICMSFRNIIDEMYSGEKPSTYLDIRNEENLSLFGKFIKKLGISFGLKSKTHFLSKIINSNYLYYQRVIRFLSNYSTSITIIIFFTILGTYWGGIWPQNNSNNIDEVGLDTQLTRALVLVSMSVLFILVTIFDKVYTNGIKKEVIFQRMSASVNFTNPFRFLAFRTIMIFISVILLIFVSKTSESDFSVIRDFDRLWKIQAALILTGWPGYARLIRGQVLYIREMTFVEAAKSVGAPDGRIMFRHILPSAWAPLLVAFTLDIGGTILSASGLSFIGLGAEPGTAEWGILVADGRKFFPNTGWWLVTFPGLAILVTTLGFNLLGDGLRDIVDPKNKR
ncbi:MAG: ABC transporter permease [Candidatus Poseidoniales archaeon]|jgi:ABC-type dipeptide/oligopeptide/nickel transport system permease subunit|tara:strand:+ start:2533 stop:4524 length:1992 start_codon:yes stop_codon:yes gene_type:complete